MGSNPFRRATTNLIFMAYICAVETAGKYYSLAIIDGKSGLVIANHIADSVNSQAAGIAASFTRLIATAGLSSLTELSYIAVNIGPGSFTGTRIGLAFVHGLLAGLSQPDDTHATHESPNNAVTLLAVDTMQVLAHKAIHGKIDAWPNPKDDYSPKAGLCLLVLPAHADKCYLQLWGGPNFQPLSEIIIANFDLAKLSQFTALEICDLFDLTQENSALNELATSGNIIPTHIHIIIANEQAAPDSSLAGYRPVHQAYVANDATATNAKVCYLNINAEDIAKFVYFIFDKPELLVQQRKIAPYPLYIGDAFAKF